MTLEIFVKEQIPQRCGVHPVYGQIAWDIYEQERKGDRRFAQENFASVRDRARLALPFFTTDIIEYNKCLDIVELCLLYHYQKAHGDDYSKRIDQLFNEASFSAEEIRLAESEWWNG